jgi:hypothetical protein
MNVRPLAFFVVTLAVLSGCSKRGAYHPPPSGVIEAEPGGIPGYQHGIDRSKFDPGANRSEKNEFGFTKVVGSNGTFGVDLRNGLAAGLPNARSKSGEAEKWYSRTPAEHNAAVLDYFTRGGIRPEQVAAVHATMSLTASGEREQRALTPPTVAGYQSVLHRQADGISVSDSVAWARMNDDGAVIAEWVYWPAIPAAVVADANKMRAMVGNDADKSAFTAHLPPNLPAGNVVIRHSSAASDGPFEIFASYDVPERIASPSQDAQHQEGHGVLVVRHFDVNGRERKLPQELPKLTADYPTAKRALPDRAATR